MGLLYTKFYLDFEGDRWQQVSTDPPVFEASADGTMLEVEDASHRQHRLEFRRGGRATLIRVTGRFRLSWDDGDAAPTK